MRKTEDLTGKKYGRLTVLYRVENKSNRARWMCQCECGNQMITYAVTLKNGHTKSCGCLQKERSGSNFIDLTGKKFGKLFVLERSDDYIDKSNRKSVQWLCQCDCGNLTTVKSSYLLNGDTKSCGCLQKEQGASNLIDLTGKKYGMLTVVEKMNEKGRQGQLLWRCRCDCGNEIIVKGVMLRTNKKQSCGCIEKQSSRKIEDLIGKKYGRLTVIGQADDHITPSGRHLIRWKCKCDCGNEIIVNANALRTGATQSCGCLQRALTSERSLDDLTGKTFGKLTVISRAGSSNRGPTWNCICECGNRVECVSADLKYGHTLSCGCYKQSKLELYVSQYFREQEMIYGIDYETQVKYDDMRGYGNGKLSFDFLVKKEGKPYCYIECQGIQHFKAIDYFGGEEYFDIQKLHDEIKRNYALEHGIPLHEITYKNSSYEDVKKFMETIQI